MKSSSKNTREVRSKVTPLRRSSTDVKRLVDYVLANQLIGGQPEDVPLDRSLVEEGILDSYDIIELVDFIERSWSIRVEDHEISRENMGSIHRMVAFIRQKGGTWQASSC